MTTEPITAISRRRRPRGRYLKTQDGAAPKRQKRIPEYLEADEVNAIIEDHTTTVWRWVKAAVKRATVCLLPVTP